MSEEPEKPQNNPEDLSQEDIDSLLKSHDVQGRLFDCKGREFPKDTPVKVLPHDFAQPQVISEVDKHNLMQRLERFLHYLTARTSLALDMECSFEPMDIYPCRLNKLKEDIPLPAFIPKFEFEPLGGKSALSITPRFAITMIDRMLGGKGHSILHERYLTELESALLDEFIDTFTNEWCKQWSDIIDLKPHYLGHESNGRFLDILPADAPLVVFKIQATMGDCESDMHLAMTADAIETLCKRLHQSASTQGSPSPEKAWNSAYNNITLPLKAVWEIKGIKVSDILKLRSRDTLLLPINKLDETLIQINDRTRFYGTLGIKNDTSAVKITRRLRDIDESE